MKFIRQIALVLTAMLGLSAASADSWQLLESSKAIHGETALSGVTLHIQEPRIANPGRYSVVTFGADGSFTLLRNRDEHVSTHIVDADGKDITLLDGSADMPEDLREKYRLGEARTRLYAFSYRFMYGLPATLDRHAVKSIGEAGQTSFNGKAAIAMDIALAKPVFSAKWTLYLDAASSRMLGLDIHRQTSSERIIFDGDIRIGDRLLPRMRHWQDLETGEYLGSDLIVTASDE